MYGVNYITIIDNQDSLALLPLFTGVSEEPIEEPLVVDSRVYGMLEIVSDLMYRYIIKADRRLLQHVLTLAQFFIIPEGAGVYRVAQIEKMMKEYKSVLADNIWPVVVSPATYFLMKFGYNGVRHQEDEECNVRFCPNFVTGQNFSLE